jgi:tetrapyrrole methylase family protein / MazG family protein
MVVPVAVGQLVSRRAPQRHPANDIQRLEELEGSIDRREVDARLPKRPVNLDRPERIRNRGENGQNRGPGPGPGVSPTSQHVFDVLQRLVHRNILQMICKMHSTRTGAPVKEKHSHLVGGGAPCIIAGVTKKGREMRDTSGPLFERLVEIMATLRGPQGCPWDREQTRESLKAFLIEEAYEVLEALDDGEKETLQEELGDLLLQVVFHAQVAAELGEFRMEDVLTRVTDKLIRRHPHVFGETRAETPAEALSNWERLKQAERGGVTEASALSGVPKTLPALLRAQRLQDKAARVGFDWGETAPVLHKVEEELAELKAAIGRERDAVESEIGDLFFSLVNLARFLDLNAEEALRKCVEKFTRRFRYIETTIAARGKSLTESSLEEMDALWEEAKVAEDPARGR